MAWTREDDEQFGDLMESYEFVLPAIERICHQDERMAEFERRLNELEGKPRLAIQYGLGDKNPLLQAIRHTKGGK